MKSARDASSETSLADVVLRRSALRAYDPLSTVGDDIVKPVRRLQAQRRLPLERPDLIALMNLPSVFFASYPFFPIPPIPPDPPVFRLLIFNTSHPPLPFPPSLQTLLPLEPSSTHPKTPATHSHSASSVPLIDCSDSCLRDVSGQPSTPIEFCDGKDLRNRRRQHFNGRGQHPETTTLSRARRGAKLVASTGRDLCSHFSLREQRPRKT